ncbi:MAG TPA: histidine phosphatase family protein [Steroidobacteraceae bacterium]|nr:histidine phosphatase family protein [Steroidobacteraceae bacterium]
MQVYLVRHPEPAASAGLCYGRSDLAVDARAVGAAAASIRALVPPAVLRQGEIFTSPLSRCLVLARELAAPRAPTIDEDLIEMHFGAWEGIAWSCIGRAQLDAWAGDVWSHAPGGGESASAVAERWLRWARRARERGAPSAVVVTHAGLIRVALAHAGRGSAQELLDARVPFASVHCIELGLSPACAT